MNLLKKLATYILFGKKGFEYPAPGLIVKDNISKRVLEISDYQGYVTSAEDDYPIALPIFEYIVAANAVDTTIRTPEEIINRVFYTKKRRHIILGIHKPGIDISSSLGKLPFPRVSYNNIVRSVSGNFDPSLRRVYTRIEEDTIRAILENGLSPLIVRYNGSVEGRERFFRIAREFKNVGVGAIVFPGEPEKKTLRVFEKKLVENWKNPRRQEGFDFIKEIQSD